jgi:hypothetical protein
MSYGASATDFPYRNRAALALIFFMHMLAVLVWMRQRDVSLPEAPRVVSIMLRPPAPQPRRKPAEPPAPVYPIAPSKIPPIQDFFKRPPAPARPETTASEPPAPVAAPAAPSPSPSLDGARAPASVQDAIREQHQADGGFGLNLSRKQAGRIDRELRGGKSGVPDEPDTPMGRFRRGLERAHIERARTVIEDSYTSPDGVIIYRRRIGNTAICYRSGNVSPLGMRSMVMGSEAGNVTCPSGVEWKKD